MIDPHVHLRDWDQASKETILHGMRIASRAGIDYLCDMPNTSPPLTTPGLIRRRLDEADEVSRQLASDGLHISLSVYAGLTADRVQREGVLRLYDSLFPRVIGFKLFAGHSTGNMGIITKEEQQEVYEQLATHGYEGLLAVHCEKESLLLPDLYDPEQPATHSLARPPEAEWASIGDQIDMAVSSGFRGTLHICHVSTPESVRIIEQARKERSLSFTITCGMTAHHALLDAEHGDHGGNLLKMNPPLRSSQSRKELYAMLIDRRIDWIESDHAPHTLKDKQLGASGIPGFSGYLHLVLTLLRDTRDRQLIADLTGRNFCRAVGLVLGSDEQVMGYYELKERLEAIEQAYALDPWKSSVRLDII